MCFFTYSSSYLFLLTYHVYLCNLQMEEDSTFNMLETPFSESVGDLIDTHLRQQGSLPVFHAAVTMDLFSRQSIMVPSASADDDDDPVVVLD